ncbi:MAG: peptidylprolyl isomerase [Clostridia bacterium]|nr:peptidylprolyl isomerase [Clostridia bacterium]
MIFCFTACDNNVDHTSNEKSGNAVVNNQENNGTQTNNDKEEQKLETNDKYASVEQNPVVTMEMDNGNIVKIELYPQIAPTTVENFIDLIEKGFYNGLTFHRVIPTFMAQGGDPAGNGTGGPGYTIKGEFKENGFKNDLTHEIGVISMARTNDKNGGGCQFFIVTNEMSYVSLDGLYAGFGKVIEGMDYVYDIVNTEVIRTEVDEEVLAAAYEAIMLVNSGKEITQEQGKDIAKYYEQSAEIDRPINPPVIKTMTVETFGVEYDEPEKIIAE